ncbi:MAG: uroporphyrinogen-III C-methyltransferase [Candidatus Caldatribacteriaceae bacterium]
MVVGKVYLVGAGVGNRKFLTVWGKEILEKADAVVYDRLIDRQLLLLAREDAECIPVGKTSGNHTVSQEEINRLLLELALQGKTVLRLKGGDPYILGRGGEEARYLFEHGVDVQIVSGVTSAVAVPAQAGIPLTHRGISRSFWVLSGSEGLEELPWPAMASFRGTLVFLMGIGKLSQIVDALLINGKPPDTPSAIIQEGATSLQKTIVGELSNIVEKAQSQGITPPGIIVIGEVVKLREVLPHRERLPLHGKRVLFVGSEKKEELFLPLSDQGAEVVYCPVLNITLEEEEVCFALGKIDEVSLLIFASKNAVQALKAGLRKSRFDVRKLAKVKIAAVGLETAACLEEMGIYSDVVPNTFSAQGLFKVFPPGEGKKVFVFTSDLGREEWILGLAALGYKAKKITAYRNSPNWKVQPLLLQEVKRGINAVLCTSPSSFTFMEVLLGDLSRYLSQTLIVAIGPTTAKAIEKRGFKVGLTVKEPSVSNMIQALYRKWRDKDELTS